MKNFFIGLIIGMVLSGGIAWAAVTMKVLLVNSSGTVIGTLSNPLYITSP